MNKSKVILSPQFLKELERLERKYPRIIDEVTTLVSQLEQGQQSGDKIVGIGYDAYKVRLKIHQQGVENVVGFGLSTMSILPTKYLCYPFTLKTNKKT